MSKKLILWLTAMTVTVIMGAISDKSLKDFHKRLNFMAILSFIIIELEY